jgi:hypothetical protein
MDSKFSVLEAIAGCADGFDLGVRNRVVVFGNLVATCGEYFSIANDDATNVKTPPANQGGLKWTRSWRLRPLSDGPNGKRRVGFDQA